jgi:dCMP deaminase
MGVAPPIPNRVVEGGVPPRKDDFSGDYSWGLDTFFSTNKELDKNVRGLCNNNCTFEVTGEHVPKLCNDGRPDWDDWFLLGAQWAALRADCDRRKVGSMIVKDRHVIATGYNGALANERGCLDGGCPRGKMSAEEVPHGSQYDHGPGACKACHSELNALMMAAKLGISVQGSTLYCTHESCITCERLVQQAGIIRIVWPDGDKRFGK